MDSLTKKASSRRAAQSERTARLITWHLSCSMTRASTVLRRISGPWGASFTRWLLACRLLKQVGSNNSSQRSKQGLLSLLQTPHRFSWTCWVAFLRKTLSSEFLGSISASTPFGRKRSTVASCLANPPSMSTSRSIEMLTPTTLQSSKPTRDFSFQTWRTLSSLTERMPSDFLSASRKT